MFKNYSFDNCLPLQLLFSFHHFPLDINDIKTKLDGIKTLSDKLKSLGNTLTFEIDQIKGKLDAVNCNGDTSCQNKINDYKNQIDVTIDFADLPDIQNSIDKIKEIQDKNLTKLIGEVRIKIFYADISFMCVIHK